MSRVRRIYAEKRPGYDVAARQLCQELREALGLSRKYAMPFLEHLDKIGFTVRSADGQGARSLAKP